MRRFMTADWVDALSDAIVVVSHDGRIVRANDACRALLGYEPDELVGHSVERLVPPRHAEHAAQRAAYFGGPRPRRMGTGKVLVAMHKDGREIPVDIALSPIQLDGASAVMTALRDMTVPHRTSEMLRLQSMALETAANGVVITDRAGTITWANEAFARMSGYPRERVIGLHTRVLRSGAHPNSFYRELWDTVLSGNTWEGEIINRRGDGTVYYEEQRITPVTDDSGAITHFLAIKQDVTRRHHAEQALQQAHEQLAQRVDEIERLNERLREQATRDPLTGLFNRRHFDETLARVIPRVLHTGQPLALIMLDIDNFKEVNDWHGHDTGDLVLQAVGAILRDAIRPSDLPCRIGGDEFVIALPGASAAAAAERAESIRRHIAELAIRVHDVRVAVTASLGIAELAGEGDSLGAALRRADLALYEAKRAGRNRVDLHGAPSSSA